MRFAPQEAKFTLVQKIDKVQTYLFYAVIALSILKIVDPRSYISDHIPGEYRALLVLIFAAYFVLNLYNKHVLKVAAEEQRRNALIQNSFDVSLGERPSQEYFDNDEFEAGIKKLAINLYENAFFSHNIASKMIPPLVIKNILFVIPLFLVCYYGFKNSEVALPVLQAFLSVHIIGGLVNLVIYQAKIKEIKSELNQLFISHKGSQMPEALVFQIYGKYEALLSQSQLLLSEKVFIKHSEELKNEWLEVRRGLNIKTHAWAQWKSHYCLPCSFALGTNTYLLSKPPLMHVFQYQTAFWRQESIQLHTFDYQKVKLTSERESNVPFGFCTLILSKVHLLAI